METALSSNMSAITSSCAQNRQATTSTITASTKRWKTFPPSARPCRPSTTTISTCSRTSSRPLLIAASCESLQNRQSPLPESASRASSSITLASLPSCMRWCASPTSPPATPSLRPKSTPPSSKRSAAPQSTTRSLRSATTFRKSAPRVLLPSSPTLAVINCSRRDTRFALSSSSFSNASTRHSPQAFSAPSKQTHGLKPKGDRNLIASISALSMISIPSFAPSASKPHDKDAKREQNSHYAHYNGLKFQS